MYVDIAGAASNCWRVLKKRTIFFKNHSIGPSIKFIEKKSRYNWQIYWYANPLYDMHQIL